MPKNESLKNEIKRKKIKLWEVAEKLGLCDSNFSRLLRYELSKEQKEKIEKAIKEVEIEKNEWWYYFKYYWIS